VNGIFGGGYLYPKQSTFFSSFFFKNTNFTLGLKWTTRPGCGLDVAWPVGGAASTLPVTSWGTAVVACRI